MISPDEVGLTPDEARHARILLGRDPTDLEWGLLGALWSEHCSYKSSRSVLSWLKPPPGRVVGGQGDNAGVVRLNDAWEVAFKVESHNHPSYVEPFHGAATGVGGIIRDVVAMGAMPIALMDS
ncbi:MAG: AIR synthase related protein, partial [Clostridia bacterium]